jgi:phosphotransferase system enzyme I (PtsI)
MLAHAHEVEQTLVVLKQARETLDDQKMPYDRRIPIGGMIEVPAAALSLRYFLKKLDFLSIGTNDLIQYTLAIDRTDDTVAHLYDPLHPAVLQLIAQTIRGAQRAKTPVAVCGEMAGDAAMTRLLLGFGLREFSMHPAQLLAIKNEVLRTHIKDVEKAAARMLREHDPLKARTMLAKLNA